MNEMRKRVNDKIEEVKAMGGYGFSLEIPADCECQIYDIVDEVNARGGFKCSVDWDTLWVRWYKN